MWAKNGFPDWLDNDRKVNTNYTEIRSQKGLRTEGRKIVFSMKGKCAQGMRDDEHG